MKLNATLFLLIALILPGMAQHHHGAEPQAGSKENTTPIFEDKHVQASYDLYIALKNALVSSLPADTKMKAVELEVALTNTPSGKEAALTAQKISRTDKLDEQRNYFTVLSDQMTSLIKSAKLSSGILYVEFCPMANNNEGGYWLSNEKEIRNPYFGNRMLKCGSVKETIQ